MRRFLRYLAFLTLSLILVSAGQADVYVHGYTKANGTYVAPYYRTSPNSTKNDNYSTKGNVNPYTGQPGTKPGDDGSLGSPAYPSGQPAQAYPPLGDGQTESGPTTTHHQDLAGWARLHVGMSKDDVISILGDPNAKASQRWGYSSGGRVNFDAQGNVEAILAPHGVNMSVASSVRTEAVVGVSLRPGVQANSDEIAQASALRKAGWVYVMPKPKSPQASWGNSDGRTTWFEGYWQRSGSSVTSVTTPARQADGSFAGDGHGAPGNWKRGGSPAYPKKVEWLCSDGGGPIAP